MRSRRWSARPPATWPPAISRSSRARTWQTRGPASARSRPPRWSGPKRLFRSFGVGLACSRAMTTLADDLVPDKLWAIVEPLLPPPRPPYGGRHRTIADQACFAATVYMARTSTPWRLLPARELGCGSPATCWRRLAEWAGAGVFDRLHLEVLDRLGEHGQLDWSRAVVDTMGVRARRGGTTWAQIQSIVASLGASSIWSATQLVSR